MPVSGNFLGDELTLYGLHTPKEQCPILGVKAFIDHSEELIVLLAYMIFEVCNKRIYYAVKDLILLKTATEGVEQRDMNSL